MRGNAQPNYADISYGSFPPSEGQRKDTRRTSNKSRLARDFGGKRYGSQGYAMEELVAELGAAFLCALELALEAREDHAAYIASWLA